MGTPRITALYAGILAILVIALAIRVVLRRRAASIGLGDGGDPDLLQRVRIHGNAVENVPIALILMLLLELGGAGDALLHGLGATLVVARLAHAQGMTQSSGDSPGRLIGNTLTWVVIVAAAVRAIGMYAG